MIPLPGFYNNEPPDNDYRITYAQCFVINQDWEIKLSCNRPGEKFAYVTAGNAEIVNRYNITLPLDASFSQKKQHFEDIFLNSPFRDRRIFIMGVPGEPPDESYFPEVDENIYQCSQKARIFFQYVRFQDRNFSVFRPVNLKPGMRVLVPDPPDNLDEMEAQWARDREEQEEFRKRLLE